MARRAQWAFRELCALLRYARKNGLDPLSIKGSIFGAFGLPQFVPTSVLAYGVDWDGDGKVDLFDLEDALASMANYLHERGWKRKLAYQEQIRVIKTYNNSQPYAETVLKLAERLKNAPQQG
jgi:membrane-bound lytic murein transglycosylase B